MLLGLVLLAAFVGQAAPTEPLDVLLDKIAKLRAQRADLQKQEDELVAQAKARFKELADKIDKLGATPAPPTPTDKLAADIAKLYADEPSKDKKVQALTLANLYKQMAKESQSPTCETCEELAAILLTFVENTVGLGADALKPIRGRVLTEVHGVAPSLTAKLDDGLRAGIGGVYSRAAAILEGVAK
jgi:hypothetical protein